MKYVLKHGDCLELMKEIPNKSIDLILCDLPYGMTKLRWDTPIDLEKLWIQYERIIKDRGAILLFAQTPFDKVLGASNLKLLKYEWIWEKTQATGHLNAKKMPMKAHENILVFYKKRPTYNPQKTTGHSPVHSYTKTIENQNSTGIYGYQGKEFSGGGSTERYPRSVQRLASDKQKSHLHSTQKPLELCQYFVETYTNQGDKVLDNCMGSGTTGEACAKTDRDFIGIDIEKSCYHVSLGRMSFYNQYMGGEKVNEIKDIFG